MIGTLTSSGIYSNTKHTGSAITDRFSLTTENQELLLFRPKDSTVDVPKVLTCNTTTIEANDSDLYITPVRASLIKGQDIETYDFTDEPVIYIEAGTSKNISGVAIVGIKFSNDLGASYSVNALSY